MKKNIEEIIKQLNWNNPIEVQEKAIKELIEIEDLDLTLLLQPDLPFGKNYWENSAKVLKKLGYPKIKNMIPALFEWLKDMNWPGALIVKEIILSLPNEVFRYNYENAVNKALFKKDEDWLDNLIHHLKII